MCGGRVDATLTVLVFMLDCLMLAIKLVILKLYIWE